ncbi:MAG: flagellar basal body L-ring protein FlgH [Thermodesulfovibrionales bacterium]|nr:flagellar basal body L-ring protein FlgH [Thermodesulfovibrionales bacterium]
MKILLVLIVFVSLYGCNTLREAREIREAPMPDRYYDTQDTNKRIKTSEGSLWRDTASLYEDRKARRVNDLVTVIISEQSAASKKATTNSSKTATQDDSVSDMLGLPTSASLEIGRKFMHFTPTVKGSAKSNFAGKGDTTREGKLTATITAKVMEVLPNGNLVIESRKEILANNEKEILVFRGIVNPDNISSNNTVQSQYVADAQIYLVGDGVLSDKQSQGWFTRFIDSIWPF